jgi:hypothetical protein
MEDFTASVMPQTPPLLSIATDPNFRTLFLQNKQQNRKFLSSPFNQQSYENRKSLGNRTPFSHQGFSKFTQMYISTYIRARVKLQAA